MLKIKLTTLILSLLVIANSQAEGNERRPHPYSVAIQVEKPPVRERDHVKVQKRQVREEYRVHREYSHDCPCIYHDRPLIVRPRPLYHGRVPVGYPVPRYSQGIVVYPQSRVPEVIFVPPGDADGIFMWE